MIAKDYVDVICNEDISKVDKVQRNLSLARLIMRSYARNLCALAKKQVCLPMYRLKWKVLLNYSKKPKKIEVESVMDEGIVIQ
jgi:hypothetical protein